jgi:hypothetical protein
VAPLAPALSVLPLAKRETPASRNTDIAKIDLVILAVLFIRYSLKNSFPMVLILKLNT